MFQGTGFDSEPPSRNGPIQEFSFVPIKLPAKPHAHASQCDARMVKTMKPMRFAPVMDNVIDAR